jgi:hypothetical protein
VAARASPGLALLVRNLLPLGVGEPSFLEPMPRLVEPERCRRTACSCFALWRLLVRGVWDWCWSSGELHRGCGGDCEWEEWLVWDDALLIVEDRRESKRVSLSEVEDAEEYSEEATDWMESDGGRPCGVDIPSRPKLAPRLLKFLLGEGVPAVMMAAAFCKQYSGNFSTLWALPGNWLGSWPPVPRLWLLSCSRDIPAGAKR